ncbi:hypothetical protein Asi03nite_38600 [Actinoplanes siamensis]|uniref:Uncharacterized protein n=1 Tax=Actinoplanes siamensis TaxID=1223317 RepID=A0A919TL65_9ACTN|nr:hypothetical protein Asi03nite_38600 [Actinoplanes siamensis]
MPDVHLGLGGAAGQLPDQLHDLRRELQLRAHRVTSAALRRRDELMTAPVDSLASSFMRVTSAALRRRDELMTAPVDSLASPLIRAPPPGRW